MIQTTVNNDSLKNNIAVSAALHLGALLLLYFGLPHLMPPLPDYHPPVPFEIVEIADITNTRIKEPEPTPKPPEQPPPPPEQKAAAQPAQPQPTPEPPKPQPAQPKEPEQVEALLPKPAEKPKPPPPKPETKPQADAFAKMLKNLEANKTEAPKAAETKPDSKSQAPPVASQAPALSTRLTISAEDALRRQIEQNWNIPIGARDIENMVIQIHIDVNPDRTVQQARIVDQSRMATDPFFRAVAQSALRAVYASSPLELPADGYQQWKGIDMTFSAKDVL